MFSKAFPEMVALFQQVTKGKEKQKHQKKGLILTSVHGDIILNHCFQFCSTCLDFQCSAGLSVEVSCLN